MAKIDKDKEFISTKVIKETPPNNEGIKVVEEIRTRKDGSKVKVIKKIRIRKKKVNPKVEERKKWEKFGLAKSGRKWSEPEEVQLEFTSMKKEKPQIDESMAKRLQTIKQELEKIEKEVLQKEPTEEKIKPEPKPERYIPPTFREGHEEATVRVSNLSEEVSEYELRQLFGQYGHVQRVYIGVDRETGEHQGFAFVTYRTTDEMNKAIKHLNGTGLYHLIITAERARPSRRSILY